MKAIRTQADDLGPEMSIETGLDCSNDPQLTRQEFKDEADVNKLLLRYGVGLPVRTPEWGVTTDFDIDLQIALSAIHEAKQAHRDLPDNLKAKYPTWKKLLNALDRGELQLNLKEPEPTQAPPKP